MQHAVLRLVMLGAWLFVIAGLARAVEFNPAGDLKTQAETLVNVDNPEYLQGLKKVVITNFMVDFVSELKYSKNLSGLEALMGADSDVSIKLLGTSNEHYQTITDKLYDQTVSLLQAQGIEVVDRAVLDALPEFVELKEKGITPVPSEQDAKTGKGLFFTAKGLPLYLADEAQFIPTFRGPFSKPKEDLFLTFGSRFSGGFSAGQSQMLEEAIAKKNEASVLKVRLTVMGGQLTPDTSFWSSGKVSTRAAATFVDFVTRFAFISPEGKKARVGLKESIHTEDIGELINITSSGTKTTDTAKNVGLVALNVAAFAARLGGVSAPGVGGFSSTTEYECRVQPESFETKLTSYHAGIVGMFAEKMRNPGQ